MEKLFGTTPSRSFPASFGLTEYLVKLFFHWALRPCDQVEGQDGAFHLRGLRRHLGRIRVLRVCKAKPFDDICLQSFDSISSCHHMPFSMPQMFLHFDICTILTLHVRAVQLDCPQCPEGRRAGGRLRIHSKRVLWLKTSCID